MSKGLVALSNLRDKIVYDVGSYHDSLSWIDIIETELKRLEELEDKLNKQKHWNEVCEDRIATLETMNKRKNEILRIIKVFADIKIDLRDGPQESIISIGDRTLTISYNKAKLLKEVLV